MDHDNDVRSRFESLAIAGLLVASIAVVLVMDKSLDAELFGEVRGVVVTEIVDQNLDVNDAG